MLMKIGEAAQVEEFSIASMSSSILNLLLSLLSLVVCRFAAANSLDALAEVDLQSATVRCLAAKDLKSSLGTGDIEEVGVGESPGVTGLAINGNTDLNDVANALEEFIEFSVCKVVGKVADVETSCGLSYATDFGIARSGSSSGELDEYPTAFENLLVHLFNGTLGGTHRVKCNVAKTIVWSV